ncbi:flagellar hook-basal body complex protein FliE [Novosphingobium sp. PC22D]|uniref:flagellar hook-basal body complex protein FliE n=1 Tax=Novosphingobium sp. PC22D TaxID=1962403 RepID=UPI000BF120C9|nr:flagellar hook-basal body complex protein FliE [Novosphingobium sp. PC22D]PEQ14305.1 flagellar hook-basal body complex protein FliE [Novosphingobium sp. PC22D]
MSGISGIGGGGAGNVQQIIALRQQIIERNRLLQDLHGPQAAGQAAPAAGAVSPQNPAQGFADTLENALQGVNSVQAKAEAIGDAYQKGEVTDVAKVMLARQEAGIAFEATLQVRNKLLNAYQDIMRMGV